MLQDHSSESIYGVSGLLKTCSLQVKGDVRRCVGRRGLLHVVRYVSGEGWEGNERRKVMEVH